MYHTGLSARPQKPGAWRRTNPTRRVVTTNHVVFETITPAQERAGHKVEVKVGDILYGEQTNRWRRFTVPVSRESLEFGRRARPP